jgi:hypothetical protein
MVVLRAKVASVEEDIKSGLVKTSLEDYDNILGPPRQRWVEIERATTGGYLLVYIDEHGWSFIETMHDSIEEAKTEAMSQYPVRGGWMEVSKEVS